MIVQKIINQLHLDPKKLFLLDSLGALLTAFLLGVVLVQFEPIFGMPAKTLYVLSFIACLFAIYSFFCYWRIPANWRPYLRAIAIANLIYCCITFTLIFYCYQELTTLGVLYFLGEIIIIIALSSFEWWTAKK